MQLTVNQQTLSSNLRVDAMERIDRMTPIIEKMRLEGVSDQTIIDFLIKSYNHAMQMLETLLSEEVGKNHIAG